MDDHKNRRRELGWKLAKKLEGLESSARTTDYNDVAI
jgi:hypothetical protein